MVVRRHVEQFRLSCAKFVHHVSNVGFRHFHNKVFNRFAFFAVNLLENYFWARNLKLVAFSAHVFNEDGKVQFATTKNLEAVGAVRFFHTHGNVCFHFSEQPCTQVTACHVLAFFACKRAVVHHEHHGDGGFVYVYKWQRFNAVDGANCFANVHFVNAVDGNNVAHFATLHFHTLQPFKLVQPCDFRRVETVVFVANNHLLTAFQLATVNFANANSANVFVVVDVANQQLQTCVNFAHGCGDFRQNCIQKRLHVGGFFAQAFACPTLLCRCVDGFEIKLFVRCAQFNEKFHYLLLQFFFHKLALVYFVNNNKHLFAKAKRLFQHVPCLWHATFNGINKKQHAVYHGQNAFHFPTEIGVAGGVDNVDFGALVVHGCVFCKNGNSPFTFDVVTVHHTVLNNFVCAENAVLLEQLVNHGGFAVVYVGNNCNVSDVLSLHSISPIFDQQIIQLSLPQVNYISARNAILPNICFRLTVQGNKTGKFVN